MDDGFDLENFTFWDVNDDSLFAEHDEYMAWAELDANGTPLDQNDVNWMNQTAGTNDTTTGDNLRLAHGKTLPPRPGGSGKRRIMLSKADKRRTYAKMYAEVFNSGDSTLVLKFLESYCTPDCIVTHRSVVKDNIFIPRFVEVRGIQAINEFCSNIFITIPDYLFVMLETKLRIRNPPEAMTELHSNTNGCVSKEGSSIVSSFSFTGTKIYMLNMENAILNPPSTNGTHQDEVRGSLIAKNIGSTPGTITASNSSSVGLDYNETWIARYAAKTKKKKRGTDGNGSFVEPPLKSVALSGSAAPSGSASGNNEIVDRYNIFLHPPRRFSTLAGTPFGGSMNQYVSSKPPPMPSAPSSANRLSDFLTIDSSTKMRAGPFIEAEGHLNFLGTFTMHLDADNKISRMEFVYSHMD